MGMKELNQNEISVVSGGSGLFQWTSHAAGIILTGFVMRAIDTTVRGRKGIISHKGSFVSTAVASTWLLINGRVFTGANISKICVAYGLIVPLALVAATTCALIDDE